MFEIKYDKDGQVIPNPQLQPTADTLATVGDTMSTPEQTQDDASQVRDVLSQPEEVEEAPITAPAKPESSQEINFRAMREAKMQAERERDEALRILRMVDEQRNRSQAPQATQEPQEDLEIQLGADEIAEGKHLNKFAKKYDQRIKQLEQELRQSKQKTVEETAELKLKAQYPDFDKVVSGDNLETLKRLYPEIAETISSNPNLYSKAVSAYTMVKKLGIHVEDTFQAEREIAKKNVSKPKTVTSLNPQQGDSPLSKANAFAAGLTPELQKQLLKEMNDARKSL